MAKQNYAIIGAGMMGREHIKNLALFGDIDLVALCDPHQASLDESGALADKFFSDVEGYHDVDQMFAEQKIEAVIVASPNFTHFDIVTQVMKHDVAILLEKPMCTKWDDAQDLYKLARDYSPLFWVGMEYRYMPPVTKFIDYVHSGMAGSIKMLCIREHRFPFLPKIGDWNRFNRNTGGTLVEKCCHFFDLMRFILQDEPVRVFASGGQDVNHLTEMYDGETPDILDAAYVIVEFGKGTRAILDLCMYAEGSEQQEEIYALGDKGKLEVKIPAGNVVWSPRNWVGAFEEHVDVPIDAMQAGDHHGATYFQLHRFHRALLGHGNAELTELDGLRAVEMGLAAHKSIDNGQAVHLDFTKIE